jgi:tRNA G18 (ribose-2'-O)-methylase SpoU
MQSLVRGLKICIVNENENRRAQKKDRAGSVSNATVVLLAPESKIKRLCSEHTDQRIHLATPNSTKSLNSKKEELSP